MAIISIAQQPLRKYGEEWILFTPKPKRYQKRIKVQVSDSIVKEKEIQPVLDAYATAVKKEEWIGKDIDWYKEEQKLQLGFHIMSYDDGSPVEG